MSKKSDGTILSPGEKLYTALNYFVLSILALSMFLPFWYIFVASFSSPDAVNSGAVVLWPVDFSFDAYVKVLNIDGIWLSYLNSIYVTVVGTVVSMVLTIFAAYPLMKKRLHGRTFFTFFLAFTMWFQAGMIPTYLNIRDLKLLDSLNGLVIAFAVNTFYIILMRTFFEGIPDSLEEAAKIDGASDFRILVQIYLPLSKPALATIGLYYAIGRWNSYFWAMILISDKNKVLLQVLLKKLIVELNVGDELAMTVDQVSKISQQTVIYSIIVVTIIPVLIVYPYLQKYIVNGVMVGAIKG